MWDGVVPYIWYKDAYTLVKAAHRQRRASAAQKRQEYAALAAAEGATGTSCNYGARVRSSKALALSRSSRPASGTARRAYADDLLARDVEDLSRGIMGGFDAMGRTGKKNAVARGVRFAG
ncbi:hypothetical protein HK104_002790 [Borealophlyctis nickersoniae]|nr:hypothetical protein HK104_002790 [Borealophlyctis nickersoniae]